jgi:hypothetical protein
MTENTQDARPTRWALYHGTSTLRLEGILADNRLQVSVSGDPKISLTPARSVAEYFACNAVNGDRHDHPDDESDPVVLTIDGEHLQALLYQLDSYSDPVWGDGECDWENEIACWDNIDPLDEVLIEVAPVTGGSLASLLRSRLRASQGDVQARRGVCCAVAWWRRTQVAFSSSHG